MGHSLLVFQEQIFLKICLQNILLKRLFTIKGLSRNSHIPFFHQSNERYLKVRLLFDFLKISNLGVNSIHCCWEINIFKNEIYYSCKSHFDRSVINFPSKLPKKRIAKIAENFLEIGVEFSSIPSLSLQKRSLQPHLQINGV